MSVTKQLTVAIDLHNVKKNKKKLTRQRSPATVWLPTFFKIFSFVLNKGTNLIQVWNKWRVSKWWQYFHFWVNYPFDFCGQWFLGHQNILYWSEDIWRQIKLILWCTEEHNQGIEMVSQLTHTQSWGLLFWQAYGYSAGSLPISARPHNSSPPVLEVKAPRGQTSLLYYINQPKE